ncbi:hypothetical protein [Grapevine virus L]|uniref:Uncharacterized protein n=1 Tax=Grapevine virus L TaxID=2283237 RepID=A0AAE7ER50_9VIRU|nr:hypothetical protein QKS62_gp2 [Grapevine virus L]QKO00405.1 hypothetical protein [Grapevine virus L]
MRHGRELVKHKYSVDHIVNLLNRLILDDERVPEDVFNPLFMIEQEDEKTLLLNQIRWQLPTDKELTQLVLKQIGREPLKRCTYLSGSLTNLFLYSKFDQTDLNAVLDFLGGPYLDSCYISEVDGKCTLKSQAGHTQVVGTTLEHTAGIISKLVGLFVVHNKVSSVESLYGSYSGHTNPLTTKEKPYLFHGVPSQYKNAPPLPS